MKLIKDSLLKLWDGILDNLGAIIVAFFLSGGYLLAINKLKTLQSAVRGIPSDYFLTPLVLLLILLGFLVKINRTQKRQLVSLEKQTPDIDQETRMVTHYGVWWKIYPDSEYIEDFPYCSCCDPKKKLVQTEWHPDETYKCPQTNTEFKLYDGIPWQKEKILTSLYDSYFGSHQMITYIHEQFNLLKELNPDLGDPQILQRVFAKKPLNRIPKKEVTQMLKQKKTLQEVDTFLRRNNKVLDRYIRKK